MMISQMQPRGLTVSSLLKQSNRAIVNSIVQDQIRTIDAKISTAHNAGFDRITHELPVTININNMDKTDAQTMVYSELLRIYTTDEADGGKGFTDTYIQGGVSSAILHIRWINGMTDAERKTRRKLIADHQLTR